MENRQRQQGKLEHFCAEVSGVWEYTLPAGTPPTASAHTSAAGYVKQSRPMTGRGPCFFWSDAKVQVILPHFILYYTLLPFFVFAIAEKCLPFVFFHPLMASGPFYVCTYVQVGSDIGSCLSLYIFGLRALSDCSRTIYSPVGRSFSVESRRQLALSRQAGEGIVKAAKANCSSLRAGANSVPMLGLGGECKNNWPFSTILHPSAHPFVCFVSATTWWFLPLQVDALS